MKILILGDIHLGKSRESTTQEKIIRQANTQAQETLESLIPILNKSNFDLTIHMGDSLRDTFDKSTDQKNTKKALQLLKNINTSQIHLLGNHELMAFKESEIKKIYKEAEIEQEFYGTLEFDKFQIIWLDLIIDPLKRACLTKERLTWLEKLKVSKKPLLVFSHYSVVPINQQGSFYFTKDPKNMLYKNGTQINEVLKTKNPLMHISAHVHILTHQVLNQTHYISAPSFSENIAAQDYNENNPGIYSVLEINEKEFCFTSYSRDFCFAKIQGSVLA